MAELNLLSRARSVVEETSQNCNGDGHSKAENALNSKNNTEAIDSCNKKLEDGGFAETICEEDPCSPNQGQPWNKKSSSTIFFSASKQPCNRNGESEEDIKVSSTSESDHNHEYFTSQISGVHGPVLENASLASDKKSAPKDSVYDDRPLSGTSNLLCKSHVSSIGEAEKSKLSEQICCEQMPPKTLCCFTKQTSCTSVALSSANNLKSSASASSPSLSLSTPVATSQSQNVQNTMLNIPVLQKCAQATSRSSKLTRTVPNCHSDVAVTGMTYQANSTPPPAPTMGLSFGQLSAESTTVTNVADRNNPMLEPSVNKGTDIPSDMQHSPEAYCSLSLTPLIKTNTTTVTPNKPVLISGLTKCPKCDSLLVCSCPPSSSVSCISESACSSANPYCTSSEGSSKSTGEDDIKPSLSLFGGKKLKEEDVEPDTYPSVPLNRLDSLFGELIEYDKVAKAEQPEAITTKLFPYQQQALGWMITRENNTDLAPFWVQVNTNSWVNKGTGISTDRKPVSSKGGILADDMGLGKTLVVISLIMANHLNGQPMFSRRPSKRKQCHRESGTSQDSPTAPMKKLSRKGSFDGHDDENDVILEETKSTKTVTIKRKRGVPDTKQRLPDNKALKQPGFKFRQMFLSQVISKSGRKEKQSVKEVSKHEVSLPMITDNDGEDKSSSDVCVGPWLTGNGIRIATSEANSSSSDKPTATLIVCPLSVLSNWTDQICSHVHADVSLQVYMYYGMERLRDAKFLSQQDIILTTYPTLTNDYSRDVERTREELVNQEPQARDLQAFCVFSQHPKWFIMLNDSPLHKIKWLRVILDEGHTIRNARTRLTKCMMDLNAKRRWVLTGTPIQNRLDDLWSVVKFLRLEPFDGKSWWNTAVASSVRRGDERGVNRLQKLLKHISIRRLKTDQDEGKPLVILPPRKVVIHEIELSEGERQLYDAMQEHGQHIIGRYIQNGVVLQKYAHCFAILMRLRQLCLHPKLCEEECKNLKHARNLLQGVDDSDDDDLDEDIETQRLIKDLLTTLSSGVDEECSVCLDSLVDPVITRCAHVFCQECIMDVISSEELAPLCPLCRAPLNENELIKVPEKKRTLEPKPVEDKEESQKSSKLEALISSLSAIRDKDPSIKSLVVSQFTSFLDLIEASLEKEDFSFVRLDGRMMQEARAQAIENFSDTSENSPKVFLLSLTAGGVGLNLTAATRVFLMDPAWNPAIEEQCFDRSHRLGQTKEVIITKYIVMDSVEERMLSLQEHKRDLMSQAFGLHKQTEEDRRRARVRDIKHLIGL